MAESAPLTCRLHIMGRASASMSSMTDIESPQRTGSGSNTMTRCADNSPAVVGDSSTWSAAHW